MSALAVSAFSLPQPHDAAYRIPQVGTGRRSQYYVLHHDGTFKYGYDTGEGAYEAAKQQTPGRQQGEFGYIDENGNHIRLEYRADEGGFQPSGSHLPQPSAEFLAAHAEARARPPFHDPLARGDTDASYDFQFAEDGQSRTEQSDSDGNVRGSYAYTDDEGRTHSYSYTAGRGVGFVIEGAALPVAPLTTSDTPAATRLSVGAGAAAAAAAAAAASFRGSSVRTGHTHRTPSTFHTTSTAGRPSTSFTTSSAGRPSSSFTTTGAAAGGADVRRGDDGSYSFSYNAGDHDRSESADANLNVDGEFSFVADDGIRRRVTYEAGSDTGFVASGDHLPKPVQPEHGTRGPSSSSFHRTGTSTAFTAGRGRGAGAGAGAGAGVGAGAGAGTGAHAAFHRHHTTGFTPSHRRYSTTRYAGELANTRSTLNPDGSYSFAYETPTHSRAETGDANINVDGDFSFVAPDDGVRRAITYEAGSDTGFIAEGAHIPVGPPVPGAPSGQPTGRIVPVKQVPFIDPLADSNTDASYDFAFDSETYSRTETADADGNVRGSYTVVDDDGTRRTYRFRAGEGVGFETEEVSTSRGPRPSRPSAGGVTSFSTAATGQTAPGTFPSHPSTTTFGAGATTGTSTSFGTAGTRGSSARVTSHGSHRSVSTSDYQLNQYEAPNDRGKYGYVLTFNR